MYNSAYNIDDGSSQDFPKSDLSCEVNGYSYNINLKNDPRVRLGFRDLINDGIVL